MWQYVTNREEDGNGHRGTVGDDGDNPESVIYRFGPFELNPAIRELRREGATVPLQPQPYRALALLVSAAGRVVSREDFIDALWEPGTHVDFDRGIISTIRRLREVLNDDAEEPSFICTVPGHGYRFIGEAELAPAAAPAPVGGARPSSARTLAEGVRSSRGLLAAGIGTAGLALALVLWTTGALMSGRADPALLAVMPVEVPAALASGPAIAGALTEELSIELARFGGAGLRVISAQTSGRFEEMALSLEEVRDRYGVEFVLRGTLRESSGGFNLNVQVLRTSDGSILWGDRYAVGDSEIGGRALAAAVRNGVGPALASAVGLEAGAPALPPPPAGPVLAPGVADRLAAARFHAYQGDIEGYREAAQAYEAVLEIRPDLAVAWVGLAESQAALGIWYELPVEQVLPPAREAAARALELAPDLAEAHAVDGLLALYYDWDWERARLALEHALELNPSSADASSWKAAYHSILGEHDQAIAAALEALLLNPLSESVTAGAGWTYLRAGRYEDAIAHCRRTYELTPDHPHAKTCLIHAYEALGRFEEELDQLAFYMRPTLGPERFAELVARGPEVATQEYWGILFERYAEDGTRPWRAGVFAALANRPDDAFEWLEKAYETRAPQLVYLETDPRFEHLRGDPRFNSLSRRIGLR